MNDTLIPAATLIVAAKLDPQPTMSLKVRRLTVTARLPVYATAGAACFDLFSDSRPFEMHGGDRWIASTGLAFEIPPGWAMLIRPRSGLAFKNGIRAFPGTIDSDYRGEVLVLLTREPDDETVVRINPGDRIAQAMLVPVYRCRFDEVAELSDTARGVGGLGSTGA